jgi:purine-binding chemotaxis protein CheW
VLSADALVDLHELDSAVRDSQNEAPPTTSEEMAVAGNDGRGGDELLVVFRLEDEEYCVDVDAVQEIIRVPDTLVRVPRTLDFVEGLVNLRGMVLPVVDLRTRLGLRRAARDERQRIVVLIIAGVRTGFVVDSVAEVLKVSTVDLEHLRLEAAPELSVEQAEVVTRVANLAEHTRMLLVLDTARLLEAGQAALLAGELQSEHTA